MRTPLYWIDGPWPGRLAIMPRPRGGDWLEDEVLAWQRDGVGVLVSALTDEEASELDLVKEPELCGANRLEFVPFPVADRGVPESTRALDELVRLLESRLAGGKNVAIHCRQGIGRSALIAACVLSRGGVTPEAAFARIGKARGAAVPDTTEQRDWVGRFARDAVAAASKI